MSIKAVAYKVEDMGRYFKSYLKQSFIDLKRSIYGHFLWMKNNIH